MIKIFSILVFLLVAFYGNETEKYNQVLDYISTKGLIIGKDLSVNEVKQLVASNYIYQNNGQLNLNALNVQLSKLLETRQEQLAKIHKLIGTNKNHQINKEIAMYITDNNDRIEQTKENFKTKNNDSWFSQVVNYVLDLLKI